MIQKEYLREINKTWRREFSHENNLLRATQTTKRERRDREAKNSPQALMFFSSQRTTKNEEKIIIRSTQWRINIYSSKQQTERTGARSHREESSWIGTVDPENQEGCRAEESEEVQEYREIQRA